MSKEIKDSFKTLGDLATKINYLQEISDLSKSNKNKLDEIEHTGFYKKKSYSDSVSSLALNLIIINACSFIDEYEKSLTAFNYPNYTEEILILKKINKPAIKRIKKWTDLKKYRNTVLAHNLSIKDKHIYSHKAPVKYNFPYYNNEVKLLTTLILIISKNIGFAFPKLVNEIDFSKNISDLICPIKNLIDLESEVETINTQIAKLKIEYS